LVTIRAENTPASDASTQTVLQDVEVLTAGQNIQPDPAAKPSAPGAVTLLLKPEDAQKLVLASAQGTIHFVLRNGADHAVLVFAPLRSSDLLGGVRAAAPVKDRSRPAKAEAYEVETFMGEKRSSTKFE